MHEVLELLVIAPCTTQHVQGLQPRSTCDVFPARSQALWRSLQEAPFQDAHTCFQHNYELRHGMPCLRRHVRFSSLDAFVSLDAPLHHHDAQRLRKQTSYLCHKGLVALLETTLVHIQAQNQGPCTQPRSNTTWCSPPKGMCAVRGTGSGMHKPCLKFSADNA
jgi:hypothetical protein